MKSLISTTLLSFLLAIGLAGNVNGQDNNQLGFICLLTANEPYIREIYPLPFAYKVNMSEETAAEFDWDDEEYKGWKISVHVDYINVRFMDINRKTLVGSNGEESDYWSCSLVTWDEVDAFVQREVSKLNNNRLF
jgi:hypothetical protein